MNKENLITIIIPVYKVEKYINKCIDSIINQTYRNIEIILVDDGSPDNCGKICDDYAKNDERIKVIHKKNGGLSDARNIGLKNSNGKYVLFVDSDDYIETFAVEYLYNLNRKYEADIAIGCTNLIYENIENNNINNKNDTIKEYNTQEALEAMLYNTEFTNNAWNKLYKRDLFENIEYPIGALYEDLAITYKLIGKSTKVVLGSKKTYNYLIDRKDSIMNNEFNEKRIQGLIYTEEILEFIMKEYPQIEKAAIARLYMECIFILLKLPYNRKYSEYNKKVKYYIRKYRKIVITDSKMPKKQKMLCISVIFSRFILRTVWNIKEILKQQMR